MKDKNTDLNHFLMFDYQFHKRINHFGRTHFRNHTQITKESNDYICTYNKRVYVSENVLHWKKLVPHRATKFYVKILRY